MAAKSKGARGISEEKVIEKTGKSWEEWFKVLDEYGMAEKGHTASARYLWKELGVPHWWAQTIVIRYEYARGFREEWKSEGLQLTVQRTVKTTPVNAFKAFLEPRALDSWFSSQSKVNPKVGGSYSNADNDKGKFLTINPYSRIRFSWDNPEHAPGTEVVVEFYPRDKGKVLIRLVHSGFQSSTDQTDLKKSWTEAMDSLKVFLESYDT